MSAWSDKLAWIVTTFWVGALWVVGYVVTPSLFSQLSSDKQLAGSLAGHLFELVAYIGITSAVYLLLHRWLRFGAGVALRQGFVWAVVVMLVLTLAGQFGIQPAMAALKAQALPLDVMSSEFAGQFKALHGIASIGYLLESLLGLVLVLRVKS
ncbi:protein of unknown function [Methylobacillus rhizosphaerae]|uniref:TMEM205-like domain-containing protein n=1 Tax=Methylobacillus rhizosphaerae TaxID=551994 RepID=A0A239AJI1_9PROT|nr:DUF4149 domain-containing protein [Methylobacillus rhizosphaerae]SNR95083.1 protein of unknown function [Methylobacillus rhizosphaerae]